MPRSSGSPRTPAKLSDSLHRQLNIYALLASAAGAGLLSPQASQAEIVYTPTNTSIHVGETIPLDLNNDGIVDFEFKDVFHGTSFGGGLGVLSVLPAQSSNQIWGHRAYGAQMASALFAGVPIGSSVQFAKGGKMMADIAASGALIGGTFYIGSCAWAWGNVANRYLGLKFVVNGETHYGWARLSVGCSEDVTVIAELTGYAYETVANQPILTGQTQGPDADVPQLNPTADQLASEPPSLGRLAQGASGLGFWRKSTRVVSAQSDEVR